MGRALRPVSGSVRPSPASSAAPRRDPLARRRSTVPVGGNFSKTVATRSGQACFASGVDQETKSKLYQALEPCEVYRCTPGGEKVKLTELWKPEDRVMVAFGRHYG